MSSWIFEGIVAVGMGLDCIHLFSIKLHRTFYVPIHVNHFFYHYKLVLKVLTESNIWPNASHSAGVNVIMPSQNFISLTDLTLESFTSHTLSIDALESTIHPMKYHLRYLMEWMATFFCVVNVSFITCWTWQVFHHYCVTCTYFTKRFSREDLIYSEELQLTQ